jgi:hypothetical protein
MAIVLDGTNGVTTNSGTLISATTIGVGGATPSTSGAGITFPATQSASTDANTLDDYEEGTWTPVWASTGTTPTVTYTLQLGKYTKIGNVVYISFRLVTSTFSGGSANIRVGGLPFGNFSADNLPSSNIGYKASFVTTGPDYGRITTSSQIELYADNNTGETTLTVSNIGNGTDMIMSAFYFV